jgi:hypothetical protein
VGLASRHDLDGGEPYQLAGVMCLLARLDVTRVACFVDETAVPPIDGYQVLLRELKARIRTARLQATLAVNEELILLYWSTG